MLGLLLDGEIIVVAVLAGDVVALLADMVVVQSRGDANRGTRCGRATSEGGAPPRHLR